MRASVVSTLLASAFLASACTHEVAVQLPAPEGAGVEVTLASPTAVTVHQAGTDSVERFTGVVALKGRVRNGPAETLSLRLGAIRLASGAEVASRGGVVDVPAAAVARVSAVRPNTGGTVIGVAALLSLGLLLRAAGVTPLGAAAITAFVGLVSVSLEALGGGHF